MANGDEGGLYPESKGDETEPERRCLSAYCRYSMACEGVGKNGGPLFCGGGY